MLHFAPEFWDQRHVEHYASHSTTDDKYWRSCHIMIHWRCSFETAHTFVITLLIFLSNLLESWLNVTLDIVMTSNNTCHIHIQNNEIWVISNMPCFVNFSDHIIMSFCLLSPYQIPKKTNKNKPQWGKTKKHKYIKKIYI